MQTQRVMRRGWGVRAGAGEGPPLSAPVKRWLGEVVAPIRRGGRRAPGHARRLLTEALQPVILGKRLLATAVVLLTVSAAPAVADGPGWIVNATVRNLVVTGDGGVNVRLSPDLSNCVSQSGYGPLYASIYPTHPGINKIKADLLAAYLHQLPVSLYLQDNTCKVTEILLGNSQ